MEKEIEVIARLWVNTESGRPPTVLEARPLVRCNDCKYASLWREGYRKCAKQLGAVREDGYCHLGEKKDDD